MNARTATIALLASSLLAGSLTAGDLAGPVYGLATAPNGAIHAADTPLGVVDVDAQGTVLAAIPGIADLAPIGQGSWWVIRGSGHGQEIVDVGQGVYRLSRGKVRKVANLFTFEVANDPVPPGVSGLPESNPFDVAALGGEFALVVDAAANDLLRVSDEGEVGVVATFPSELVPTAHLKSLLGCPGSGVFQCGLPPMLPAQAVPTSVAVGLDGHYYVGELKGFPSPQNESRIWRIAPGATWAACGASADCELLFDGGFTSIIDLAFAADGRLYVVELDENGFFAATLPSPQPLAGGTISACDPVTLECEVVDSGLVLPTAITFGKDGTLWSTEFGPVPGLARVVEIP